MLFPVGGKGGDEQRVVCQTLLPRHCLKLGDELHGQIERLGLDAPAGIAFPLDLGAGLGH
uniref:Putative AdoMet-dependent methyltransferase n=2 Tax=unclassified Caudoviricetes TaxID=2788787 RepID=A0A8S5V6G9_9CAUD|nr:MAG TPA: putative AdoMet-dependent methyltransferase [Siphoviridae sp. ctMBu2]DAG02294.1 MAG TPA: putative AdoMet-dependent methyltransferase [Myoviridae sp. ctRci5]DAK39494.1 MAG TPA: putative AdoMet-dependent methyltransferase [Caudoviricetes sp.]DAN26632.1 MAG TPA: putative AdoMet-dependent methyltransferase [Caudoviricetes sp.]DAU29621.1 MAG TPA: putative AdoMet-dependent methyltransferase [Caudoviricetes sp.]